MTRNAITEYRQAINKQMGQNVYRIVTPLGCVDVTEDHSLLDANANMIRPVDCVIGGQLLHSFPAMSDLAAEGEWRNMGDFKTGDKVLAMTVTNVYKELGQRITKYGCDWSRLGNNIFSLWCLQKWQC